jgi:two-component system nitrogen regulation response regulator GlnG
VLEKALAGAGFTVESFDAAEPALRALMSRTPDLIFTDVRMPGMDGMAFMDKLRQRSTTCAGGGDECLHRSAEHRCRLPSRRLRLPAQALRHRCRHRHGAPRHRARGAAAETDWSDEGLVGDTPAMREVFRAIGRLSRADLSVLITGETGTGKELIARALHRHSPRANGPFIALNTAAIAPELLESELFGHEQGAFTGATRRHQGRFEQAERGTLFLDEIGDMPIGLQTRLLRVLAEGEFYRVGGRELIRADVRVIAATHQDLRGKVERGEFRADSVAPPRRHAHPLCHRCASAPPTCRVWPIASSPRPRARCAWRPSICRSTPCAR